MRRNGRAAWDLHGGQAVFLVFMSLGAAAAYGGNRPEVLWMAGGHSRDVHAVSYAPGGERCASVSEDGTIKVWRTADGALDLTVTPDIFSSFGVYGVGFSPDGSSVLASGVGGAYEYEVETGEFVRSYCCLESAIATAFSPDGQIVAMTGSLTGLEESTLLFDHATGDLIDRFDIDHIGGAWDVLFSADGEFVITAGGTVRYIRLSDGEVVHVLEDHGQEVRALALSPDGSLLVSGGSDDRVKIRDATDGTVIRALIGHTNDITDVVFSPDGTRLVSSSKDETIRVWDVETGVELYVITGHEGSVGGVDVSPDGTTLLSGGGGFSFPFGDATVRRWHVADGAPRDVLTVHSGQMLDMDLSVDGTLLATTSGRQITIRSTLDGALQIDIPTDLFGTSVALSSDASTVALGDSRGTIMYFDSQDGSPITSWAAHARTVSDMAFSNDGRFLISSSFGEPVSIWDADTGMPIRSLDASDNGATKLTISTDSEHVARASLNAAVLSRTSDGGFEQFYGGHTGGLTAIALSLDGARLASGSSDRTVRIWNVGSGDSIHTLIAHEHWISAVAFSPSGTTLASGSGLDDRTMRIWDTESGALLETYTIDVGNRPSALAYTPDDRVILLARQDATVVAMRNPAYVPNADFDASGTTTTSDFMSLVSCLAGPGVTVPPRGCSAADFAARDLDVDLDVDLKDAAIAQRLVEGP